MKELIAYHKSFTKEYEEKKEKIIEEKRTLAEKEEKIINEVTNYFSVNKEDLLKGYRWGGLPLAKKYITLILRDKYHYTYTRIGNMF